MKIDLSGQRALVCGASQGIGAATAMALAETGSQVTLLARNESQLEKVLSQLPGSNHSYVVCDLTETFQLSTKIIPQLEKHGPHTILVNNSGGPKSGPLLAAEDEEFIKGLSAHLLAAQHLVKALLPGMKERQYGRIVNIISTSVKTPLANLGVSNSIRGAMASWSKTLANELGVFGITVNNILPGYTMTSRLEALRKSSAERLKVPEAHIEAQWKSSIPLGRYGRAEEVAQTVAFLASPLASYISGVNLPVDGGRTQAL